MGAVPSTAFNFCRRMILRYNVQNRANKFLENEKLPSAPRHAIPNTLKLNEKTLKPSLTNIHAKSEQLCEYLKKVYLTSTSEIKGTPSKRPLPKKENEQFKTAMFFEPETPAPGHVTLTNVIKILYKAQDENTFSTPAAIASEYKLDRTDARNLITYYSLFRLEKFDFMNPANQDKSIIPEVPSEFVGETKRIAAK